MVVEMKKLFYYLRLYLYITAQYIKVRMQFRMDFIISSIAIILTNITGLLSLQIIFKSIRQLAGWEYYELLFIYGFSLLALSPLQLDVYKRQNPYWKNLRMILKILPF